MGVGQGFARGQDGLTGNAHVPQPLDPHVSGFGLEERPPADRPVVEGPADLVGVVAILTGLVAQDVEQGGVHPFAAEPHLDQFTVRAPVHEVGKGGALGPVALHVRGGPLGPPDHGAQGGQHPVVQRGLSPSAFAGLGPPGQESQHGGQQDKRRPRPGSPGVNEDRTGPVTGQLGAEPGPGLDQKGEVLDRAAGAAAGPAPGVHQLPVRRPAGLHIRDPVLPPRPRRRRQGPRRRRSAKRDSWSRSASVLAAMTRLSRCHAWPQATASSMPGIGPHTTRTTVAPRLASTMPGTPPAIPRPSSLVPAATSITVRPAHGREGR